MNNRPDWSSWILQKNTQFDEELNKAKDIAGDTVDSSMLMSQLESLEHHIAELKEHLKINDVAPDWVKSKIAESASSMSDIAHYIMGIKEKNK